MAWGLEERRVGKGRRRRFVDIVFGRVRLRQWRKKPHVESTTPHRYKNSVSMRHLAKCIPHKTMQRSSKSAPPISYKTPPPGPARSLNLLSHHAFQVTRTSPPHSQPQPRLLPPPLPVAALALARGRTGARTEMHFPLFGVGFPDDGGGGADFVAEAVGVGFGVRLTFDLDLAVGCAVVGCVVLLHHHKKTSVARILGEDG